MPSDNVLIIFVKYPQEGFVKTRLAREIGKKNASELYRLFVETILARIKDKSFIRVIFYTPISKRKPLPLRKIRMMFFGGFSVLIKETSHKNHRLNILNIPENPISSPKQI